MSSKMSFTKTLFILFMLSQLMSCDNSTLSNEKITSLHGIGANILINQSPYNLNENYITVKLFDRSGEQIGNPDITIRVNDQDLRLKIQKGKYTLRSKTMTYYGQHIPVSDAYDFDLILSDSTIVPLAYIKVIPVVKKNDIIVTEELPIDSPITIMWENLKEFDNLMIICSLAYRPDTDYSDKQDPSNINQKIKEKGTYTVPRTYCQDPAAIETIVRFRFHVIKSGLIQPDLLANSKISIQSEIIRNTGIGNEFSNPEIIIEGTKKE